MLTTQHSQTWLSTQSCDSALRFMAQRIPVWRQCSDSNADLMSEMITNAMIWPMHPQSTYVPKHVEPFPVKLRGNIRRQKLLTCILAKATWRFEQHLSSWQVLLASTSAAAAAAAVVALVAPFPAVSSVAAAVLVPSPAVPSAAALPSLPVAPAGHLLSERIMHLWLQRAPHCTSTMHCKCGVWWESESGLKCLGTTCRHDEFG